MIRRMRESNDNVFYCAECTYDKSNGTMFLYTTDITEVRGSIKPKDSMKVEGGFLVRRKYFRSEYEAQDYIDSLPNAMPMSRNESFRMGRSNESMVFESAGKKCYIVVNLEKAREPKIIGVFLNKKHAEKAAYEIPNQWRNIIETTIQQ